MIFIYKKFKKMKKIIKLTESDLEKIIKKVLKESTIINEIASDADDFGGSQDDVNTEISNFNQNAPVDQKKNMRLIQRKLKELGYNLGNFGPNKDGVDGRYGRLTLAAIKDFQRKNGIKSTGWVGTVTAPLLSVEPMKGVSFVGVRPGQKKTSGDNKNAVQKKKIGNVKTDNILGKKTGKISGGDINKKKINKIEPEKNKISSSATCIGLPKNMCSQISSKNAVTLGSGDEAQCAAYVTKCLTQYDKDFRTGNAWKSASWLAGGGGTERFNLFKTNVDWNKVWKGLKDNKITKSDCMKFYGKAGSDTGTIMPKSKAILNLSKDNAPDSSGVSWRSLKPGDVVGLVHDGTLNKGRAFCERMVDDLSLDEKGNFKQMPFTFNTHVGFVTAIKDGIPIIAHNVSNSFGTKGNYSVVPATQMLSKGSSDRIVWAYSDPQVESSVQKVLKSSPEPKFGGVNYGFNKLR
jgi:peptidoglycan hydrolase-like protein with peptidoglycan-binding domain